MKAIYEISYWKSGSGFSNTEEIAYNQENDFSTPEELKQSVIDWWYENRWNDSNYDGHLWEVTYYDTDSDPMFDTYINSISFWVYPEDIRKPNVTEG